jgi:hypothetical protein
MSQLPSHEQRNRGDSNSTATLLPAYPLSRARPPSWSHDSNECNPGYA